MCAQANNSRFLDDDMFRGEKESNESNESNESKDSDMESFLLLEKHQQKIQPRCLIGSLSRFTHGISLLVCLGLLINTVVVSKTCRKSCLERFNAYSPVLEAINEEYQDIRFKYSLWYQSPYKGPPTPEVHQAWNNIMQYGQISVSADDILRIGHNLSSVQYPESAGGGYLATTMGTHAIHCLHYIWQDHYIAVSPEVQSQKAEIPEMYERHYEHCVDYIRQFLMCKFDTTIMPFNWVLDHQNPTPNGNTIHKCVKWDFLQDWLKDRAVQMPEGFKWRQPADAVTLDWNP